MLVPGQQPDCIILQGASAVFEMWPRVSAGLSLIWLLLLLLQTGALPPPEIRLKAKSKLGSLAAADLYKHDEQVVEVARVGCESELQKEHDNIEFVRSNVKEEVLRRLSLTVEPDLVQVNAEGREGAEALLFPFYPEGNLERYLRSRRWPFTKRIKTKETLSLAIEIARALEALHSVNRVHGRVTPSNIFLLSSETAVLGGIGGVLEPGETCPSSAIHGYLPPEATGSDAFRVSAKFDVFAFGSILLQLEKGYYLRQEDLYSMQRKFWNSENPPNSLVARCWSKEPEQRPQMQDIVNELVELEKNYEDPRPSRFGWLKKL
jgi:serine/threonine protein kinase